MCRNPHCFVPAPKSSPFWPKLLQRNVPTGNDLRNFDGRRKKFSMPDTTLASRSQVSTSLTFHFTIAWSWTVMFHGELCETWWFSNQKIYCRQLVTFLRKHLPFPKHIYTYLFAIHCTPSATDYWPIVERFLRIYCTCRGRPQNFEHVGWIFVQKY